MNFLDSHARRTQLATLALLAATAVVYQRVSGFEFVNYDDHMLVRDNPHVNTGLSVENVAWAFTSTDRLQWAPITWMSHMLDFQVFGSNPSGHHVTSALFHLFNTLALLLFLHQATGHYWRSAFVAAVFALHPLHVEPVAWLSARKDVVSTAWLLLALLSYVAYARRPAVSRYLVSIGLYALSLMSKPMYVSLPLLLLLLDHWPLRRLDEGARRLPSASPPTRKRVAWTLIVEKVPFCVLAVVFSGIAYVAQSRSDAITPFQPSELPSRAAGAAVALARYVWQTAWPAELAVVYPREAPSPWMTVASAVFLVTVSVVVLRLARARRYLVVGWLWFIVALLPVIGIVQIGPAMMADKFMYVPLIGLAIIAAWGIPDVLDTWGTRLRAPILAGAASLALALCAAKSWDQLASWKDSVALYTKALAVTENNFVVLGNLAAAYNDAGRLDEAMQYYHAAIRAEPRFEIGYANIGHLLLMTRNDCERATPYFVAALRLRPEYQKARSGLAYCQNRPPAAR